jgi:hypothetical protein
MSVTSFVQYNGKLIEKGTPEYNDYLDDRYGARAPSIAADEGSFVSPIDGKVYSGRAGMREHNKIHNVINNRDLVGLPYQTTHREYVPDRAAIRSQIVETMRSKGIIK